MNRLFVILMTATAVGHAKSPSAASTLTVLAATPETGVHLALNCNTALESNRCTVTVTAKTNSSVSPPRVFVGGPGTSAIQILTGRMTGEILSGTKANQRFCGAMMGQCPIAESTGLIGAEGKQNTLVVTIDMKYEAEQDMDLSIAALRHPVVTGRLHDGLMEGPVELVITAEEIAVTLEAPTGVTAPGLEQLPKSCPNTPCRMLMGLKRDRPFRPGGPIFGIGARFDDTGDIGLIGRVGYEIAAPKELLINLHTDTDFHQFATLALTAEGAFGTFLYSTLGIGPVMEVVPDIRPGIRSSAGLGAYVATIVGTFDVYFSGDSIDYRGAVLIQAGF